MSQAISSKKAVNATGCLIPFFAIFALSGLFAFTSLFLLPCINVVQAKSWTPTSCTIASSAVASRGSGKDLRYYPDVLFRYSVGGQTYDSTRFSFFKLGFKNTYQPQSLLRAYPYGATATCYVNPSAPAQAVLDRSFQTAALSNLLSLIFVAVGVGGILWTVLSRRAAARNEALGQKSWRPKNVAAPAVPSPALGAPSGAASTPFATGQLQSAPAAVPPTLPADAGGVVLKPVLTPAGQSCLLLFMALFWNGFVGVFLREVVFDNGLGFVRIGVGLFLIPFVLIGLLLIFGALASMGAMFVPRPQLTANTASVPLGGQLHLKWQSRRGLLCPRRLSLWLEAREEATYTRGTDSVTERNIFLSRPIFESTSGGELNGQSSITIPADAMHSFEAPRNKILWAIKVKGDVPLWPNFEDEYRLVILPATAVSTPVGTPVASRPLDVASGAITQEL